MLQLIVPEREFFDEKTQEFFFIKEKKLDLEHSLISISKWESKWKKPFLNKNDKTYEESIDYIRCMTLTPNVDPKVYYGITQEMFAKITEYIDDSMTATWFNEQKQNSVKKNSQAITSELIYYWMVAYNIPFECQKWHLNRLLALIRICDIKNSSSDKKMKKSDIYARNRALNAARRKHLGTNG